MGFSRAYKIIRHASAENDQIGEKCDYDRGERDGPPREGEHADERQTPHHDGAEHRRENEVHDEQHANIAIGSHRSG